MRASDSFSKPPVSGGQPWWRELTRYHWLVFIVASLGWLFDTMDQQLFNIARRPAMQTLLRPEPGVEADPEAVGDYSNYATSIFLIGWGAGGIGFGIFGDLFGRIKALTLTILLYSIFTGLSAFSTGFTDFAIYRFLTGLGVGGEFGVGVSLVAEVMPDRARPFALGMLQALSAVGNVTAALITIVLAFLARAGVTADTWRVMFLIGTLPALLVFVIIRRLQEPERWRQVAAQQRLTTRFGLYMTEIFRNRRWAGHALVGLALAASGIIGLWAIGFFVIDLQRAVFQERLQGQGLSPTDVRFSEDVWAGITSLVLNVGAFFGIYAFSYITHVVGRRPAFAGAFLLALGSTLLVFWRLRTIGDIVWMVPLMGFCQLALFGGYAIYFPELFPTRLRSTGVSFCYNGARFVAATGPAIKVLLTKRVYSGYADLDAVRYAGMTMCAIFLVGLLVLPFAPETKGKPLPE
jgi:MFS family permease